jgi:hypothetical protein
LGNTSTAHLQALAQIAAVQATAAQQASKKSKWDN